MLGVRIAEIGFPELTRLGIEYGIRVIDVAPRSAAATGGVQPGDVLLTLNGRPLYSVPRLRWVVMALGPDDPATLEFLRGGVRLSAELRLGGTPAGPEGGAARLGSFLGVSLQPLTAELREALAVDVEGGMLVSEVIGDSPAERAGLQVGDLVVGIGRRTVRSIEDVKRALAYFEPGAEVPVTVIRNGDERRLQATLEAPRASSAGRAPTLYPPDGGGSWSHLVPPPEYWQRWMDELMHSLGDSLDDLRERLPERQPDYY
jgi:S1-C subfamily serine protease